MVTACLEDCGHKKGTVQKLMEARILPILALELRSTESREVRGLGIVPTVPSFFVLRIRNRGAYFGAGAQPPGRQAEHRCAQLVAIVPSSPNACQCGLGWIPSAFRHDPSRHLRKWIHSAFEALSLPSGSFEGLSFIFRHFRSFLLFSPSSGCSSILRVFWGQDKDSRIAEPVIETIGCASLSLFTILFLSSSFFSRPSLITLSSFSPRLISHNLSSRGEVDEFLRSGILEWLVEAVRTHPDGQVRQAIVVGLGEIGFGLKKAVVREKRGDEGWKKEDKPSENEEAARGVEGRGRRDGRAGRWLLGGSVSHVDLLSLESESWVVEDSGAMDLASRCRRGVRMAGLYTNQCSSTD
ncbi:hypothetical protein BLNAU_16094 [Blattamonas nauphoetae]|uniref:Uncharacterized protein n=1 Tax=Blattamonas nauphoetae TaxID=2049346 RepID=A0ABQ9X939_9EUKA|nr:hypothetical protein BLNAU_16094 [Blattamonas nauphoetae]